MTTPNKSTSNNSIYSKLQKAYEMYINYETVQSFLEFEELLNKAICKYPNSSKVMYYQGIYYMAKKDYMQAINTFIKSYRLGFILSAKEIAEFYDLKDDNVLYNKLLALKWYLNYLENDIGDNIEFKIISLFNFFTHSCISNSENLLYCIRAFELIIHHVDKYHFVVSCSEIRLNLEVLDNIYKDKLEKSISEDFYKILFFCFLGASDGTDFLQSKTLIYKSRCLENVEKIDQIICKNIKNLIKDHLYYRALIYCPFISSQEQRNYYENFLKKEERKLKLRSIINKRGIQRLIHFTAESNLDSIMDYGILSREELRKHGIIHYSKTDNNSYRDNCDYISISVTNPNIPMLECAIAEKRIINPYIIEIDPKVLLDENIKTIFCTGNAARIDNDILRGSSIEDFENMFTLKKIHTNCSVMSRSELSRFSNEPTDIQAEILVKKHIPVDYIVEISPWYEWKKMQYRF